MSPFAQDVRSASFSTISFIKKYDISPKPKTKEQKKQKIMSWFHVYYSYDDKTLIKNIQRQTNEKWQAHNIRDPITLARKN